MYRLIILIGVVVITNSVLGCGEDEAASSSSPSALTKAQFIRQADRICAKFAKERESDAASFIKRLPGGPAEAEAHLEDGLKQVVAPSMQREAEVLGALEAPEGDTAEVAGMIEHLSEASTALVDDGSKALRGLSLLAYEREAAAYGLKICSNPY